jgi:hypothetical protein
MPRVDVSRIDGLPDILSTSDFEFIIGTIPGGSTDRQMVIKCQQVSYPGTGHQAFDVPLHGFIKKFRGQKTYPGTLSVTYAEDRTMDTTKQIEAWLEYIAGSQSGTSAGYKRNYSVNDATLITYDTTGQIVSEVVFKYLMPTDKPDIQYDGSNAQPYIINMTFSYERYESSLVSPR